MAVLKNTVNIGDMQVTGDLTANKFIKSGGTAAQFLKADGSVDSNSYSTTDTKNTAGSSNSTSKLFLVGATTQSANPQTYSNSSVFATNGDLTANTFTSNVAAGTAPFTVTSTTAVTNLNADMLDGNHASDFATSSHTHTLTINADSTSSSQLDLANNTKYILTAGGSTFVFKTPAGGGSSDIDSMHMSLPELFITYNGSMLYTYSYNDVLSLIRIVDRYCNYYSTTQIPFPGINGTAMYEEIRAINMPIYIRWDVAKIKIQYKGESINPSTSYNATELNDAPCLLGYNTDVWNSAYRLSTVGFIRMYLFDNADLLHIEIDLGGGKKLISNPKSAASAFAIPVSNFATDIINGWQKVLSFFQTYGVLQWETIDIFNNSAGTVWG